MGTSWKFEVIHKALSTADNMLSAGALCEIAGVSRSGYYRWVKAAVVREAREERDRQDFELILWAYNERGYSKGAIRYCHMSLVIRWRLILCLKQ